MASVLAVIAIFLYSLGSIRQYQAVSARHTEFRPQVLILGTAAVLAHGLTWFTQLSSQSGVSFGFYNVGSLISLVIAAVIVISALKKPLENLFLGVFPMAALLLIINEVATPSSQTVIMDQGISAHIIFSIMAYSILTIAAFQAILLMVLDYQLKHKHMTGIVRALPPLQTMDRLLFEMLGIGTLLLTLAIGSGFFFLSDLFGQHLAHKTAFTILAWVTFTALLLGHWRFGWRGTTASKWTLVGTGFLILAYFGSKFVLEIVLQKA